VDQHGRSQVSACGIYGGQRDNWAGFLLSI